MNDEKSFEENRHDQLTSAPKATEADAAPRIDVTTHDGVTRIDVRDDDAALDLFRKAAAVASKPFIYLSAGVGNAQFTESLRMATEAGTDFSGVLCGRATWKDGMPIYATKGLAALEDFLSTKGVENINAVNAALKGATAWYKKLGVAV